MGASQVRGPYARANIGGYCHLSTGQEAATVGAVAPLRAEDYLLMSYRTHGLVLARGTPPETVMAELFGREGGAARGRGGSMHLLDVERNVLGGWGIVCGQLPIATGVALALVQQGRRSAVLCELGDGAVNVWQLATSPRELARQALRGRLGDGGSPPPRWPPERVASRQAGRRRRPSRRL
jgi:TPP-dependent pyruvate/acetoin dehydrogenase alpha subunit